MKIGVGRLAIVKKIDKNHNLNFVRNKLSKLWELHVEKRPESVNLKLSLGRSPGLGSPDPASLEMQTLYCKFLHFENTHAFSHPTSQLVYLKVPPEKPITIFSYQNDVSN